MTQHVLVEADGGSRGNPGPAGYGAVVKDASGAVLAERKEGLGIATNNVAEYHGLIAGLAAAAELGASTVDVRMDSKLVVEQMSGRWKVKHPSMQPLAREAGELAARFDRVAYQWIPRAENSHADGLANEAMDDQAGRPPKRRTPEPAPSATVSPASVSERPPAEYASTSAPGWTGFTGTPTRLILLRHGQTELSVAKRYSGHGDPLLTERGTEQALAAAKRLAGMSLGGVDDEPPPIISSPLRRAVQTAGAVADALGGSVRTERGLIETDFGEWEGLTFTEAAERDPELHRRWLGDSSVPAPSGESFDEVHRRVRAATESITAEFAGRTVIVVSHVTPIKSLLRLGLDAGPSLLFRLHLDLASLSIVEFYPDGNASVRLVNDTAHHA